ncbi:MAG: hypothetical protein CVV52_16255 [Spirochaetae bacterium HGW-Spirochaetae-8]|nr:MAG: hypothetical protein CVV52_16255 [Spirochaetae bacterium HGW-Spirochaetae-8]
MKKFLVILIALIMVSGVMFAEAAATGDTDSLTINTTVRGVEAIQLSTAALALNTWGTLDLATLNFTSETDEVVPAAQTGVINLRTNTKLGYYVVVSALPLTSTTVDTEIGFSLIPSGSASSDATAGAGITPLKLAETAETGTLVSFSASTSAGMRVSYQPFTVTLTSADWLAATAATDYTTTVTFNLWTN